MKKNKLELEKFQILSLKEPQLIFGGTISLTSNTEGFTVHTATAPTTPTGPTGLTGPTGPGGETGPDTTSINPSGDRPVDSSLPCQLNPGTVLTTG
jgi:hypothetical protein